MSAESRFLTLLRLLAHDPAAQGLMDDVALLPVGDTRLVLTSDTIVEGVHYLPADPPADIGWKLAAVNLSDLAAKGARPVGCLLNYALAGDEAWDAAFLEGLGEALDRHAMPLLGGDTVKMPAGSARSYSLTAIGEAMGLVPSRAGARPGDRLFVFSDGVFELKLEDGSMWPMEAFTEFMARPLGEDEDRIESLASLGRELTGRDDFEDDFSIIEVQFE